MSALQSLLDTYRSASVTEREKGTYFEELIFAYFRNEATYRDLYDKVWTYGDWAKEQGLDGRDTGIDLVARTQGTGEYHAIQCKLYAEDYRVQKKDIDSFFTASGKAPFSHRIIVATTDNWSKHAEDALQGQQLPINKIDLQALEDSQIDWAKYQPKHAVALKARKQLRDHQQTALNAVAAGLKDAERGKLIMACGTGKTFTSLKIAEQQAGKGKRVLFLVPSLSLLSQTLTEWTQESETLLHSFAVCSDSDVGKKRKTDEDAPQVFAHELRYPATTKADRLAAEMLKRHDAEHMSVVFSTYHSIDVISRAQHEHGLAAFDLIICDEAHRTTGATFDDDDESTFVRVHDADYIRATKRLYMTATPRIYGDSAKVKAESGEVTLCSMDDEALYGKELFVINFSEAVQRGLLTDYKVLVLTVEESAISRRLQDLLKDEDNQLKVDDAAKIVGCWKALAKQGLHEQLIGDDEPMKRAVAFCQVISPNYKGTKHKVSSINIASMFQSVVEAYQDSEEIDQDSRIICEAEHVDGGMNASQKEAKLNWLKDEAPANTCRILSNVRCLSEGVDVPALDAVLFLTPRNSQVDVVQSVGRVMRNAPGKKRGYVVLPVVIPAGMEPHEALNDNQTYKVVWQVLQALRSHDDSFDAMVNKLDLIGSDPRKMEVIAITDKADKKAKKGSGTSNDKAGKGQYGIGEKRQKYDAEGQMTQQAELTYEVGEIEKAIYAKIVDKCGNRHHWEDWANDIAKIARTHIDRIQGILENPANTQEQAAFNAFAAELRDDLNDSISDGEIVEMLAQHLVTKPVFDALFEEYSFASNNPMSKAMQGVLNALHEHHLAKEADTLEKFYASVRQRAAGIDNAQGKQKIIVELYDKFFRNAFPKMTERLGIVYTPVEVVDFILYSVNHLLQQEFGQTLGSKGVHIIDPFTGTGTFITRLLQSGLVKPEELPHKYKHEIHANELVLLAYYIAAINIEAAYHGEVIDEYTPFEGICLTDTFQMYEKDDLVDALLEDNSARRKRQKALDIRVIVGNPPYSVGQKSENDNNDNVEYPTLDGRIRSTYAARSSATLAKGLYDSYIRAIRWASDRIGNAGIIGFVTNAGFLEANTADGLRKCLADEFSSLYVLHLRGNQRTIGETSRKEGGKIFGSGSRAPIAISLLVKNPDAQAHGQIHFHDIGDYLSREEKLEKIASFSSIAGIEQWQQITPDEHGDWLRQRDDSFNQFIVLGDKKGDALKLFDNFSQGVLTARDAWAYNASQIKLTTNMTGMIGFYNTEVTRFNAAHPALDSKARQAKVDGFVDTDPTRISWTRALKQDLGKNRSYVFKASCLMPSLYRPFTKQWLYFDRRFNEMVYQIPRLFPTAGCQNLVILVKARWSNGQIALITDKPPAFTPDGGEQCFPLYLYDEAAQTSDDDLFAEPVEGGLRRRDAITHAGLTHFQSAYPGDSISKEDLFYYVYGILHSPDYRERFADNLSKELPRIPAVKKAADFWAFSKAGRALADLHLNYETIAPYPLTIDSKGTLTNADYRVEKMKLAKKGDKSTVIYNHRITLKGIPEAAWDYVVNGKAALDWVMERQAVRTDKASGIVNDANDWAIETMGNPKYPLELFQRVVTVSLETQKIVNGLPLLDI
ncbi:DEAD/DEAH box helicase family protein [Pseudomonas alloputida]|uniref:DEAD/DEAH box helicase n=2 Tax=Pseudomonas TaxID=286 RepID=UPI000761F56B|nr:MULTISPECIES: type ISP restriction/modification enzyme [Pseudomonas]MCE0865058.1 DEAD/DEAH box helicase family protein [Pseudomonas alloputida]MCE0894264.1 DEAD/DEAH box helicase family protein [Pseudomonas alloputida]MCE0923508.1 DEAD/DEAH box helicase family protein [Pseudomonas alloputida]MCE1049822.1 DEAD/DEAH box helicase family protein [Pseudomonas alloputida]MCE1096069.1 DEAD/DEAH box helicase family protein [Pseudomonas alloputida]